MIRDNISIRQYEKMANHSLYRSRSDWVSQNKYANFIISISLHPKTRQETYKVKSIIVRTKPNNDRLSFVK
ncbi:hypothetical protein YC2023_089821 [Brassica napus]